MMIKVRNVNLQELALGLGGKAQISSRYKRLYRFLRHFKIDLFIISHWLFKLFFSSGQSVYIASAEEQIDFIRSFLLGFGEIRIAGLLADREFC